METQDNLIPLQGSAACDRYFKRLNLVIEKLDEFFAARAAKKDGRYYESVMISEFLAKMSHSIDALRKKYVYNPNRILKIDRHGSGFPGYFDVNRLTTDLRKKERKLDELPTVQALKQEVLDYIFKYKREPAELLWRLSERSYYEMLNKERLFLPFIPASSIRTNPKRDERFRSYTFSWACYDFMTNRPYIHVMMFDQDATSVPLETQGENYKEFLEIIRSEGSRSPGIGVIALGIDSNLSDIHPKVIKRLGIGPICAETFSGDPEDLFQLVAAWGENEDDFILIFEEEVILSSDQQVSRSIFSFGQARETFHIPESDPECYSRKASKIYKHILMPHKVLQHMDLKGAFREYKDHEIISYHQHGRG